MTKYWAILIFFSVAGAIAILMSRPTTPALSDLESLTGTYAMKEQRRFTPESMVNGEIVCTSSDFFGNCSSLEIRDMAGNTVTVKYMHMPAIFGSLKVVVEATGSDGKVLYIKDIRAIASQWLWSSLFWLTSVPVFFAFILIREARGFK